MSKIQSSKIHSSKIRSRKSRAPEARDEPASDGDAPDRSPRELVAAWFSFHRVCPERACRRAMRCCGGAMPPCFTLCWPHIPERDKVAMRATFAARLEGVSVEDAMTAGAAEVLKWEALTFGLSQPASEQVSEPGSSQQLRHNAPRIRA